MAPDPHAHARQIHVPAATQSAAVEDLTDQAVVALLLQHFEVDETVVHGQPIAYLEHVHQLVVVDVYGTRFHVARQHADGHHVTIFQIHGFGDVASADLGPLRIEQDGHRIGQLPVQRADPVDDLLGAVVIGVGHVEPHHIHTGVRQLFQHWP